MRRTLHRAVLATRQLRPFGALYRVCYRAAIGLSARALSSTGAIQSVYLHRGLSRDECDPGVSDIDLILVREPGLAVEDEYRCLASLADRVGRLKGMLPMFGDLWLGDPGEIGQYLRWGGLRAWEDPPHWKLLSGKPLKIETSFESPLKRRWLDPWAWLFVSHMELCRRIMLPSNEWPAKREADLRKLYLDVRRFSDFILSENPGDHPLPRATMRERSLELSRLSTREVWLDSSRRLARASRRVLESVGSGRTESAAFSKIVEDTGWRRVRGLAQRVVLDAPYHIYVILPEGASESEYARLRDELAKAPSTGVPLILDSASWSLALQSSYLGGPLGWLGSEGSVPRRDDPIFPGWGPAAIGDGGAVETLREDLAWEIAAEAASWMALWWRYLWIAPNWSNRFVLYHLYTRALALRLVLSGEPSGPFSDWQLLLARASSRFKDEARSFARIRTLLLGESAANLDSTSRGALAPGHLSAIAGQMRALQSVLSGNSAPRTVKFS